MAASLNEFYQKTRAELIAHQVETAALDARILICHALGMTHEAFILHRAQPLSEVQMARAQDLIAQRIQGRPVAKIIGYKEFYGRNFKTTDDTLDPRPDSETLIEVVLHYVRQRGLQNKPLRLLDLGTGTGCLVLTLLAELPQAVGVAVDRSSEALSVAQENADALGVSSRVACVQSDWLQQVDGMFDIVISNPPYIPADDIPYLAVEVRTFDPVGALNGGKDGLDPYRVIIPQLHKVMHSDGLAAFELGKDQDRDVAMLLQQAGFSDVRTAFDLGGIGRVVSGIFRSAAE